MHKFPYLNFAKLKPYDARFTVYMDYNVLGSSVGTLKEAIDKGNLCGSPCVTILCELSGEGSQPKRFTITLDQAIKISNGG